MLSQVGIEKTNQARLVDGELGAKLYTVKNYRDFLRIILEFRIVHNKSYSQGAFARDIGIEATRLSQILQHKQGLSPTLAEKIAERLGLSNLERDFFVLLVRFNDARSKKDRMVAKQKLEMFSKPADSFHVLKKNELHVLSHWCHYAVIELLQTKDAQSDSAWIAQRLGLPIYKIEESITLLKRLGLIRSKAGKLVPIFKQLTTTDGISVDEIKNYTVSLLDKAKESVYRHKPTDRDNSTLTVAVSSKKMQEFKNLITEFRRKFNDIAMEGLTDEENPPDEVYVLGIQFFRLTESGQV